MGIRKGIAEHMARVRESDQPVQPTEPGDVQAFVDSLKLPQYNWIVGERQERAYWLRTMQAFAVQAINAWIVAHPPIQPTEPMDWRQARYIDMTPPVQPTEPVALTCPQCGVPHIDEGEWATRPHKTHQCQSCGHEWRPFEHATVGIAHPPVQLMELPKPELSDALNADTVEAFAKRYAAAVAMQSATPVQPTEPVDVQAISDALDYAHDCASHELSEAQSMYGQYPRDGLGRKITYAEDQLAEIKKAKAALAAPVQPTEPK